MKKVLLTISALLCISACDSTVQTTSGHSYLEKHNALSPSEEGSFEDQLRKVASIEPTLKFPARIGLARIDGGRLTSVPSNEADSWIALRDKLGKDFGEFVPVSPLVAQMAQESVGTQRTYYSSGSVMNEIRLGAAKQHLDAVLIYEIYTKTDAKSNLLSIADLTIIGGYLLPSKTLEAEGFANAMLIDVLQGYPYGTVSAKVDKEDMLSSRWGWGSDSNRDELNDRIKAKAAANLSQEVEKVFEKLRAELAAKQLK
jgi:hypothetical protein